MVTRAIVPRRLDRSGVTMGVTSESRTMVHRQEGVVYHTTLHFCAVVVCIFHPSSSFQNRASGEPGQLAGDTRKSRARTPRVARDPGGGFLVLSAS